MCLCDKVQLKTAILSLHRQVFFFQNVGMTTAVLTWLRSHEVCLCVKFHILFNIHANILHRKGLKKSYNI